MKTLSLLVILFAFSCNNAVEPQQPEITPIDTIIASDSVDTLLLIRTVQDSAQ